MLKKIDVANTFFELHVFVYKVFGQNLLFTPRFYSFKEEKVSVVIMDTNFVCFYSCISQNIDFSLDIIRKCNMFFKTV